MTSGASVPARCSSHGKEAAVPMNELRINQGAGDCASCEKLIGDPISVVMTSLGGTGR
jgi:hypothetical protein